jgi:purine-binding chemotaxis protein CheW
MSGRGKGNKPGGDGAKPAEPDPRSAAPAADSVPPHGATLTGEDRIYAFADSLDSQEQEVEGPKREYETWVSFALDKETYAFPVTSVQEILLVEDITRIPHAPKPVRGVTNMRGRILPVVDLRVRLGLPKAPITERTRILVSSSRGRLLGLLVDGVRQVMRIDRLHIQPPPDDVVTEVSDYITGICDLGGVILILLDVDKVLWIKE